MLESPVAGPGSRAGSLMSRDSHEAIPQAAPAVDDAYAVMRRVARRLFRGERSDHTLQPTALVHEAVIKLMQSGVDFSKPDELVRYAARVMRQVLIDHARRAGAQKRGGDLVHFPLDEREVAAATRGGGPSLVDLEDAMRELWNRHAESAQVVELRLFGGLTNAECARNLRIEESRALNLWRYGRARLREEMAPETDGRAAEKADGRTP